MPFLYWSSEHSRALRKHQESMSSSCVQDSSAGDNCCKGKGNTCMLGIDLEAGQGVNVGAEEGQQFSRHGQPVPIFLHNNTTTQHILFAACHIPVNKFLAQILQDATRQPSNVPMYVSGQPFSPQGHVYFAPTMPYMDHNVPQNEWSLSVV